MNERHLVFGYVNPDTDGICSSIVYSHLLEQLHNYKATPVLFGSLNAESDFVLRHLCVQHPEQINTFEPSDLIHIVDTHSLNQLPNNLPVNAVVEVVDHHPIGDPDAFPNAKVTNETIGAVATIIYEEFKNKGINLAPANAAMLYAAIISNTLNLSAPTTTDRDRAAVQELSDIAKLPVEFPQMMFAAQSEAMNEKSTREMLLSDYKEFDFSGVKFGMAQLEVINLDSFIKRGDLIKELENLRKEKDLDHILFNGANIQQQTGAIIAPSENTRVILERVIGAKFHQEIAMFNRILLRKSDLIPQLKSYFASNL